MLKNSSACSFLKNRAFIHFISTFSVDIIDDTTANQILEKFQATVPFTMWGRVDWEKRAKKMVVGKDSSGIAPALEKLMDKPLDLNTKIYIELSDPDMPFVKTTLASAIEKLPNLATLSFEIFIFDEAMSYVIEVNALKEITVGSV